MLDTGKISSPTVSLPKGGGAITSIGETFQADTFTGTAGMAISIPTPPCRACAPQLSLDYSSGSGNGIFGIGFQLDTPSISRKTALAFPRYDDTDMFLFAQSDELVPQLIDRQNSGEWAPDIWYCIPTEGGRDSFTQTPPHTGVFFVVTRYRLRTEGLFARIERWVSSSDGDTHWRTITRDNITSLYGATAAGRITDPDNAAHIFRWLIERTYDARGHQIVYEYSVDQSNKHLSRIKYGNYQPNTDPASNDWHFEVDFTYSLPATAETLADGTATGPDRPRPDPFSAYKPGFQLRTSVRCIQILVFHRFAELAGEDRLLVSSMQFEYAATSPLSLLTAITHSGYNQSVTKELPPLEFTWSQFPLDAPAAPEIADFRPLQLASGRSIVDFVAGGSSQMVDLYGEGLPGILYTDPDLVLYARPLGGGSYEPAAAPQSFPSTHDLQDGETALVSLVGDGKLDLVVTTPTRSGYYAPRPDGSWEAFASFAAAPTDLLDAQRQLVDVTGDGLADLLFVEEDLVRFYPAQGPLGYGPPQQQQGQGPLPITRQLDAHEVIRFGDPFGDGVSHLMRIRNGSVECWPNLGYGRFGPKIAIANPPRLSQELDASRLFFADIDGSGTTDLIYVYPDHVAIYLNRSGNYFSDPVSIALPAPWNELGQINFADVLGNGTACLVFTSVSFDRSLNQQYCDFTNGAKPYLLIGVDNNLGATTHITYSPSTQFYLADEQAGTPWVTRLPFPVQVVEHVETIDHIGGTRLVASYSYHHGYFDPIDREFRGFGRVERLDAATFDNPPEARQPFAVPPLLTKIWYHTGSYAQAAALLQQFQAEYYQGDPLALSLPDAIFDPAFQAAPENFSEAQRTLHGEVLREEVYALDQAQQPDRSAHPYIVKESSFYVRLVQPKAGQPYAVCFAHPSEELAWHYERNPADPRISHDLTLEVDAYGNLLKSLAIGYGRRSPSTDPLLTANDRATQAQTLISYTAASFTNPIDDPIAYPDDYHTPLLAETQTFELTGFKPAANAERFSLDEWAQHDFARLANAPDIPYEQTPSGTTPQKRLFEHRRTLYRPDDLGAAQDDALALLPLGRLEPLALPGETYTLALTPGLRDTVYYRNGQELLAGIGAPTGPGPDHGGYRDLAADGRWWLPAGREFYSPTTNDSPPAELAYARSHFFLPQRFRDAFFAAGWDTEHSVTYDTYDMLIVATSDPLGNTVTAQNDYRVLQPWLVTDPNGNRTAAAFDALGMLAGTAVMGKPAPAPVEGDSLAGFVADLDESVILAHLANPLADPSAILGSATTRLIYDLFAYQRTKDQPIPQPAVVYTLVRETHAADLAARQPTKFQHSFAYSDGFGRVVQHTTQAAPGPGPLRDAHGALIIGADGQPEMTAQDVSPRWVVSGWTIYNNKGQPVRQFEPFFSDTQRFEFAVTSGVSSILFYDPLGRVVATLHPNQSWAKVVFDPWRQATWDVNDTIALDPRTDPDVAPYLAPYLASLPPPGWRSWLQARIADPQHPPADTHGAQPDQDAAVRTLVHANTPTIVHFDVLGRAFLTIADNGNAHYSPTRVVLDIEGNQRALIDANGRIALRHDYDMLGTPIHEASMEAGEHWLLNDAAGLPFYRWDSREHQFRTGYDRLRRPTDRFLRTGDGTEQLLEQNVYGEAAADPAASNLRGRLFQQLDQAGLSTNAAYDFKGNLLQHQRQIAREYRQTLDWALPPLLETEIFVRHTRYDALNRIVQLIAPHSSRPGTLVNVIQPRYDEANLLAQVDAWLNQRAAPSGLLDPASATMAAVTGIDYNAKGQRTVITYGNGVGTSYRYDPETFELAQLTSTRRSDSAALQDLRYTYDPIGNITHIRDAAQQTIYFRNQRVEPSNDYSYDAIYRLLSASGREHLGQAGATPAPYSATDAPRVGLPQPGDGSAMARYSEQYLYDAAGNILTMQHQGNAGQGWTRRYIYAEPSLLEAGKQSNRLSSTIVGGVVETYSTNGDGYDPHGNMLHMPQLPLMRWDEHDQLRTTAQQVVTNGGTPETAYYVYDAGGQRVRQVIERQAAAGQPPTRRAERIYLGGCEIYREYAGNGAALNLERATLHVMDDQQTVALVETRTMGSDPAPQQLTRYQLANHLGSALLELDAQAQIISYEEYSPFGSTTYQAVRSQTEAPKRYRYSGQERDDASGFYYYGARYYMPWLGRWICPDPAGMVDGPNLYAFVRGNPIAYVDIGGLGGGNKTKPSKKKKPQKQQGVKQPAPKAPKNPTSKKKAKTQPAHTNDPLQWDPVAPLSTYVSSADPGVQAVLESYGRPSTANVQAYQDVADRIEWDIQHHSGQLTLHTETDLTRLFDLNKSLLFNFNPFLHQHWQQPLNTYSGQKTGKELYAHNRGQLTKEFTNVTVSSGANLNDLLQIEEANYSTKPFEVHHLLYKAKYPDIAVHPANLVLVSRSPKESQLGPYQHELMHRVASGNDPNKFKVLQRAFIDTFQDWAGGTTGGIVKLWAPK